MRKGRDLNSESQIIIKINELLFQPFEPSQMSLIINSNISPLIQFQYLFVFFTLANEEGVGNASSALKPEECAELVDGCL